jgi:hypothetical protein
MKKKIAFIVPPTVELLDLAGPVQVFTEAKFYSFDIDIEFYAYQPKLSALQALHLESLPITKKLN